MPSFNCHERWFFFFFSLSCVFEREREREREVYKRKAEDYEIEKWGGGGDWFIFKALVCEL